ncbi:hypothetical protein [Paracoccus methylarcula]|uniref:hypothetical protein n=1 Tax=Paracoccus methylarcula TaxID=72022 RepID=UPI0011CD75EE|nr:hypothetical protein [Paracoccus methylarcula]
MLLARAGGSIWKTGACMKPASPSRGLDAPSTARLRDYVVTWEFMGGNGILRPVREFYLNFSVHERKNMTQIFRQTQPMEDYTKQNTRYGHRTGVAENPRFSCITLSKANNGRVIHAKFRGDHAESRIREANHPS